MKYFQGIMLTIGIGLILFSIYLSYSNYVEDNTFEKVDAVIIEFVDTSHFQNDGGQVAVIGFLYHGDSIYRNTAYYSAGMEIGKHYIAVFPKGRPHAAELEQALWTLPLFCFGFGAVFFVGPAVLIRLDRKRKERWRTAIDTAPARDENALPTSKEKLTGRLVFTALGAGFSFAAIYVFNLRIHHPDTDVDWGLVAILSGVALLLDFIVLVTWVGVILESRMTEVDADFVRVVPEDLLTTRKTGTHRWKLECTWQDIVTGQKYTWTSIPFAGNVLYYNRKKIRASYHSWSPKYLNEVDISFVSSKSDHGIELVNAEVITQAVADADRFRKTTRANRDVQREQPRSKGVEWTVKLVAVAIILLFAGWWSYSCDDSGMKVVEDSTK